MARARVPALLALLAVLPACAALPHDAPLATPRGPDTIHAEATLGSGGASALSGDWPGGTWWTRFGDPQLDALIAEGLANSPDAAAAAARFRAAAAMRQQARAATLPQLDIQGSVDEIKLSNNTGEPAQFIPQGWLTEGTLDAALSFDIDLWGRDRARLAAATSETVAARIDVAQARLQLTTAIAAAYVDYALAGDARQVRAEELANRIGLRALVTQRFAAGLDTRGSVRAADAEVSGAQGALAAAEQELAMRRNQIAALVGAGPDRGLILMPPVLAGDGAAMLPADVTTALVARRPDVAAARARLDAATARIRAARADFFPAIRLSALYGVESLGLGQLLTSGSTMGSAGPAVTLPIFHGGALRGALRGAGANADVAVADYNRAVIAAFQQVADAVTGRVLIRRQRDQAGITLAALQDAAAIGRARYRAGLSTYLDVLTLDDRVLAAQVDAAQLAAATRSADITLVRALGGGFAVDSATPALTPISPKDAPHG